MSIKLKDFIGAVKKSTSTIKKSYKNLGRNIKDSKKTAVATYKSKSDLKNVQRQALDTIMKKHYPGSTVVNPATRAKRKKQFKQMISEGKTRQAFDTAKKLTKQFKKDNPKWSGITK